MCHENPRWTVFNEQDWRTSLYANAAHILIRRPKDAELYSVFADDISPDRIEADRKIHGICRDRGSDQTGKRGLEPLYGEGWIRRYVQRTIEKAHAFIGLAALEVRARFDERFECRKVAK